MNGPAVGAATAASIVVLSGFGSDSDFGDSYTIADARRFHREFIAARDLYSDATKENGHLQDLLNVQKATLDATDVELAAMWARPSKANTMVMGKGFLHLLLFQPKCLWYANCIVFLCAAMMAQSDSLRLIATNTADTVNARGEVGEFRL